MQWDCCVWKAREWLNFYNKFSELPAVKQAGEEAEVAKLALKFTVEKAATVKEATEEKNSRESSCSCSEEGSVGERHSRR